MGLRIFVDGAFGMYRTYPETFRYVTVRSGVVAYVYQFRRGYSESVESIREQFSEMFVHTNVPGYQDVLETGYPVPFQKISDEIRGKIHV